MDDPPVRDPVWTERQADRSGAGLHGEGTRGTPAHDRGRRTQVRRFIYVEDLADGCVAALAPIAANRVYNLVGDETTSVRAIARTIRDIVGMVPIEHVEGRVGDLHGGNVSGERAARELGWRATTIFADGVRRYVDWVTAEEGTPNAAIAASTDGSAATVARQDPGAP